MATETLRPNGAGSETAIDTEYPGSGTHWTLVDESSPDNSGVPGESPITSGTLVYNNTGVRATWQRDLYALPDSSGFGIIDQIEVFIVTVHNVSEAKVSIRTGGTTYDGDEVGTSSWTEYSKVWSINPQTGVAWTWDDIDALEIGVNLSGSGAVEYPLHWTCCTQVYVVITSTPQPPTVTIQAVTDIVTTTAKGHGNVTALGDAAVTEHGHCWDLEANPTPDTDDSKTTLGAKSATGTFVSIITNLTEGQTYAHRAYATNSYGTSYSSELTFVAGTAGAQSYPTDAQTRVTSLIHRFDRGTYTLELRLGEVVADFDLPELESRPKPAFLDEQEREIEQMLRRDKAIKERQEEAPPDEEVMREQDVRLWQAADEPRVGEVAKEAKMREQDRRLWEAADALERERAAQLKRMKGQDPRLWAAQGELDRKREEAQRREVEQMLLREEARRKRREEEAAGRRALLPSETLTEEQRRLLRGF